MPLSKQRNRDRMRETRLHAKKSIVFVQPKPDIGSILRANPTMSLSVRKRLAVQAGIEFDADGNVIYED